MNSIIAKCIEELKKKPIEGEHANCTYCVSGGPRIDYVLGMLETLMEVHIPSSAGILGAPNPTGALITKTPVPMVDEQAAELDARAREAIGIVKSIGQG